MQKDPAKVLSKSAETSAKSAKGTPMTTCDRGVQDEMREIVVDAMTPFLHMGKEAAQYAVARVLHITPRRVRAYWQREVRMVRAEEADRLRQVRKQLLEQRIARLDAEAEILRSRLQEGAP